MENMLKYHRDMRTSECLDIKKPIKFMICFNAEAIVYKFSRLLFEHAGFKVLLFFQNTKLLRVRGHLMNGKKTAKAMP